MTNVRLLARAQAFVRLAMADARVHNLFGLIAGFMASRGSLFIVQTWLMTTGRVAFVAAFGIGYLLISLAYQIVDWGGQMLLARDVLTMEWSQAIKAYWSLVVVRLALALLVCLALAAATAGDFGALSALIRAYITFGAFGVAASAFNLTGVLDGLGASGVNGLINALPLLLSAIVLPFATGKGGYEAGAYLGAAFSAASVIGVLLQFAWLRRRPLAWTSAPSRADLWRATSGGWHIVLATTPGQFVYRAQVIAATAFGPAFVGSFVYAKQILSGVNQIVWFCRRTELARLAQWVKHDRSHPIKIVARSLNFKGGALCSLGLMVVALSAPFVLPERLDAAAHLLSVLAVLVVVGALSDSLVQMYTFRHRQAAAAYATCFAAVLGVAEAYLGPRVVGQYGIVAAEFAMYAVLLALLLWMWERPDRTDDARASPKRHHQPLSIVRN